MRGQSFPPPSEAKIIKIAEILGQNPDTLLALAGKISSDLAEIIKKNPEQMAELLRISGQLTPENIAELTRHAETTYTQVVTESTPFEEE